MADYDFEGGWRELSGEVISGMLEWRLQPVPSGRATFSEIEAAIDERLSRLRARMLQDAALASAATDWAGTPREQSPSCPKCQRPLVRRGKHRRQIQTYGGREVDRERTCGVCPECGAGFFPLDEELSLLSGSLSPTLGEHVARLGAWIPFEPAAEILRAFT